MAHLSKAINFNKQITTWITEDIGTTAYYADGNTDLKKGFQILLNFSEDHSLTQMVNIPTRVNETLDLVFTNQPHEFSKCSTKDIQPISDHHIVHFEINTFTATRTDSITIPITTNKPATDISRYDLKSVSVDIFKKVLNATQWNNIINNNTPPDQLNNIFSNAIVTAAKTAKAPLFHTTDLHKRQPPHILKLIETRDRLHMANQHPNARETDKISNLQNIMEYNAMNASRMNC